MGRRRKGAKRKRNVQSASFQAVKNADTLEAGYEAVPLSLVFLLNCSC